MGQKSFPVGVSYLCPEPSEKPRTPCCYNMMTDENCKIKFKLILQVCVSPSVANLGGAYKTAWGFTASTFPKTTLSFGGQGSTKLLFWCWVWGRGREGAENSMGLIFQLSVHVSWAGKTVFEFCEFHFPNEMDRNISSRNIYYCIFLLWGSF